MHRIGFRVPVSHCLVAKVMSSGAMRATPPQIHATRVLTSHRQPGDVLASSLQSTTKTSDPLGDSTPKSSSLLTGTCRGTWAATTTLLLFLATHPQHDHHHHHHYYHEVLG